MSRVPKLAVVAAAQVLALLLIAVFALATGTTGSDTVVLAVSGQSYNLRELDLANGPVPTYEISVLDASRVSFDAGADGHVWVELQEQDDGTWSAIGVHKHRQQTRPGTVLMKALDEGPDRNPRILLGQAIPKDPRRLWYYGIEDAGARGYHAPAPVASPTPIGTITGFAAALGSNRPRPTARLVVRVDHAGHATPLRFIIDGRSYPAESRHSGHAF